MQAFCEIIQSDVLRVVCGKIRDDAIDEIPVAGGIRACKFQPGHDHGHDQAHPCRTFREALLKVLPVQPFKGIINIMIHVLSCKEGGQGASCFQVLPMILCKDGVKNDRGYLG